MVRDPVRELRLVVGKLAMLLTFVYLLALIAAVVGIVTGNRLSILGYVFLLLPGAAFVVASRDSVRLHRTDDAERARVLWRSCALYGGIGLVLLIAAGVVIDQIGN